MLVIHNDAFALTIICLKENFKILYVLPFIDWFESFFNKPKWNIRVMLIGAPMALFKECKKEILLNIQSNAVFILEGKKELAERC